MKLNSADGTSTLMFECNYYVYSFYKHTRETAVLYVHITAVIDATVLFFVRFRYEGFGLGVENEKLPS